MPLRPSLLLWLCPVLLFAALPARGQPIAENDLKAAFVFNFAGFTEWPAHPSREGAPLVACVAASSALRRPLESLAGQRVKARPFSAHVLASLDELARCDILIVDAADRPRIPALLRALGGRSVLTIGDAADSHHDGLVVSLAIESNRLRFRVNLKAARLAQIEISSKVLRLAEVVE